MAGADRASGRVPLATRLLKAPGFVPLWVADGVSNAMLSLEVLAAATVGVLAALGVLQPWQVGVAALVSGLVYATEMPARQRALQHSSDGDRDDRDAGGLPQPGDGSRHRLHRLLARIA